jgi:hypothetical protein
MTATQCESEYRMSATKFGSEYRVNGSEYRVSATQCESEYRMSATNFRLSIPCNINKQFPTPNQNNAQTFPFYIYTTISNCIFLQVSVRKVPSSGKQTKVIPNKTKLISFAYI